MTSLYMSKSSRQKEVRKHLCLIFSSSNKASTISIARGGLKPPSIGLKSMQKNVLLALLRLIFALKTKKAPPNGIWDETWSRI